MTRRTKNILGWLACTAIVFTGFWLVAGLLILLDKHRDFGVPILIMSIVLALSAIAGWAIADDLGWIKNKEDK